MQFEVIYTQKVLERTKYVIECESEDVLLGALEDAEDDMRLNGFDTFDDFYFSLQKRGIIKVIRVAEDYQEDWSAPEYYDHRKVGD